MVQRLVGLNIVLALFMTSQVFASPDTRSSSKHNLEAVKDLGWFAENTTRIYSLVKDIEYKETETEDKVQVISEFSSPESSDECSVFDTDKKYSTYYYYQIVEEINQNENTHSNWFEGQRLMGPVTKKTVVYCFAK